MLCSSLGFDECIIMLTDPVMYPSSSWDFCGGGGKRSVVNQARTTALLRERFPVSV